VADERMKAEARQIHVLGPRCVVERSQNVGYPFCVFTLSRRPSPVAKNRSRALSLNERIIFRV
jgi:hypothetical protein